MTREEIDCLVSDLTKQIQDRDKEIAELKVSLRISSLREILADVSHDIWSHWMRWQFNCCTNSVELADGKIIDLGGDLLIPASRVERWKRQMNQTYQELSEREKESDREQADKILKALLANR